MMQQDYKQLRWIILLLSTAVILPTVCVLWFMGQAVKNERLVVRQKLVDVYRSEIEDNSAKFDSLFEMEAKTAAKSVGNNPLPDIFMHFVNVAESSNGLQGEGLVVYDANGNCIYPAQHEDIGEYGDFADDWARAERLEFSGADGESALQFFIDLQSKTESRVIKKRAQFAQARILKKQGKIDQALQIYYEIRETGHGDKGEIAYLRARAQLRVTELEMEKAAGENNYARFSQELRNLLSTATNYNTGSGVMLDIPSAQRIFLIKAASNLYFKANGHSTDSDLVARVEHACNIARAETLSLGVSERFPTSENCSKWTDNTLNYLPGANVYAIVYRGQGKTVLKLLRTENVVGLLKQNIIFSKGFRKNLNFRVIDSRGVVVDGTENPASGVFIKTEVSRYLPGWSIELFLKDAAVFEQAAKRQTGLYVWAGALVILFMFVVTGFGGSMIARQVRLSRLRNDFFGDGIA